jgi:hypothetical protein
MKDYTNIIPKEVRDDPTTTKYTLLEQDGSHKVTFCRIDNNSWQMVKLGELDLQEKDLDTQIKEAKEENSQGE